MFSSQLLRQVARAGQVQAPRTLFRVRQPVTSTIRQFAYTPCRLEKEPPEDRHDAASTASEPGKSGDHEGQFARTDDSVRVEYPEEDQLPPSQPVQGRGGAHFKQTLASFSMEGRVAVVTGGARGLGLVMAQALVTSGADVAIVDMNRDEGQRSAQGLIDTYKAENPDANK